MTKTIMLREMGANQTFVFIVDLKNEHLVINTGMSSIEITRNPKNNRETISLHGLGNEDGHNALSLKEYKTGYSHEVGDRIISLEVEGIDYSKKIRADVKVVGHTKIPIIEIPLKEMFRNEF